MIRQQTDYFVLDTLANDLEDLEHIINILNSTSEFGWRDQHPEPFTTEEVIPALLRGIREGNIEACVYSDEQRELIGVGAKAIPAVPIHQVWFRLTARGRTVLNSWDPPPLPGNSGA